ncbi:hypothetical protein AFLA_005325 [Aspergillus flavus NRRL3357]|nr:hypothetical protein AFLA_005325 [Aspergillus flavus NRRL3357]
MVSTSPFWIHAQHHFPLGRSDGKLKIATSVRRFRGNPVRSPRRKLILILAGTGKRSVVSNSCLFPG